MTTTQPLGLAVDGKRIHYSGDLTGKIEGQILGPNTLGEWWVIVATDYDLEPDQTTAFVRVATADDLQTAVPA